MSSSDDEQDDTNTFDQLKSIRAFTVEQLYSLHPDVTCPKGLQSGRVGEERSDASAESYHDQSLYQNLVEYEQLKDTLIKLQKSVKQMLKKTFDHVEKVWVLREESERKIGMCQQGKIAEYTLKYKKAIMNEKQLDILQVSFDELSETISRDYVYYSFESQMKRHKVATSLSTSYQIEDEQNRKLKLKSSIATLIDFIKHLGDSKSDFGLQCQSWLRALIRRFLEGGATTEHIFVITQICRGPPGISDWVADLIECKSFEQTTNFETPPLYITHCATLLSELFNNLRPKIRRVTMAKEENLDSVSNNDYSNQNWSLIDPRFSCSEELNLASNGIMMTESDIVKLCLKVPIAQIFRTYVRTCLQSDEFNLEIDKNYEYIMLKLITIGTIIIKTYQLGLETFNSIQYGTLIEYLSSQIRQTVIVLSDQWAEFKNRLKRVDTTLLMRLQVEYDNFILRSILIILELRQSGIWRHLSRVEQEDTHEAENTLNWSTDSIRPAFAKLLQVTKLTSSSTTPIQTPQVENKQKPKPPKKTSYSTSLTYEFSVEWFKEVSEPMLWHILWQFYNNAFVSSCDYHGDNYWLEKFSGKSVAYLFVNKMKDSPPSECSYLINSITSILLSRTRQESNLVEFIARELFNLTFKHESLKNKITERGLKSLIRGAERFPHLISLFIRSMDNEDLPEDVVMLIKNLSLMGWICDDDELNIISKWLIEKPLTSNHNKCARLLITKLLFNDSSCITKSYIVQDDKNDAQNSATQEKIKIYPKKANYSVSLKIRRLFALLLHEALVYHLPENNDFGSKSLGAYVEVAFGTVFCERNTVFYSNLIELAVDVGYQQLYVWAWRLLFTLDLHILNQPETDWSDIQSRSGTSRSIKNTVLLNDSFHPVPSVQDAECLTLSNGIRNSNPVALFVYLLITDVTWQEDNLDSCLTYLITMANSGHMTPSMLAMKHLTICHLNDLSKLTKDQKCLDYFTSVVTSDFDSTRIASLISSQLLQLEPFRQIQLSEFYINVLLEVATIVLKQQSTSWFSSNEHSLEKIACLLDYIARFNFTTQRQQIIRKFYNCSYSIQTCRTSNSWLTSLFTSNSLNANSTRREFLTILHLLTQKFKKYSWLRYVTTECDTIRLERIWEDIVVHLSTNESANLDSAIKKVCPQVNPSILKSILPIESWLAQIFDIVESDLSHSLCPLIWYNFFLNYFANHLNGVSVGSKLISPEILIKLLTRLDSLVNYHNYKNRNWASATNQKQKSLAELYRAYKIWLQDRSLLDAYVEFDKKEEMYFVPLLNAVMSSTEGACMSYVDTETIDKQNRDLCLIWSAATSLAGNETIKEVVAVDSNPNDSTEILTCVEDEASDAVSLILRPDKSLKGNNKFLSFDDKDLTKPVQESSKDKYLPMEEILDIVKKNFHAVFEESSIFGHMIDGLEKLKTEISDLIQLLYNNKKRELTQLVPCDDASECTGPAKIKFEIEEATIDDRKSECIQDRRGQCRELLLELVSLPSGRVVHSTITIEDYIKQLIQDHGRCAKSCIMNLLSWINESKHFRHLNGRYYVANHLLKSILEIMSNTVEVDTFNTALVDVCFEHPSSVQIFSPHLSPSSCSSGCFLELYRRISEAQGKLGPMATFVLLSKFDIDSWLRNLTDKNMHQDIIQTTCSGLKHLGKQADECFALTFGLYKRHIQIELAPPERRKPKEINLVLERFLAIMNEQLLCPCLWNVFMGVLGLEKQLSRDLAAISDKPNINTTPTIASNERDISIVGESNGITLPINLECGDHLVLKIVEDIARFAESQKVFDYHALNDMVQTLIRFIEWSYESSSSTLLELYYDYLEHFSIVLVSLTFMWIRSISETYPDNHQLIWKQFLSLWYHWVYLSKNCQNVSKTSYSLLATQYVGSIRYMINKNPSDTQNILQSVLTDLAKYVTTTKEVVYLELTILQRCLKNLPWSSLVATRLDFENLATLSEQESYNVSDLVSHIILQINVKESLSKIHENNFDSLQYVAERLATTIVLQSMHLRGFRLHGSYFILIPIDRVRKIAMLILARMEFANLEHSQNNKLLVNLLRSMCIKLDLSDSLTELQINDGLERSLIYAQFVSNYMIDLIKNHSTVLKYHKPYLNAVFDNSLQDLKILLSPDVEISKKTSIYMSLLECCNSSMISEECRLLLAECLTHSSLLQDRPIIVMEVFHSLGQIMSDGRVLVYSIEKLVHLYLKMNGHYEKVWKSFSLTAMPSDLYLGACVEDNAPIALLVYFEALNHNGQDNQHLTDNITSNEPLANNNKIWSSFLHWMAQLTAVNQVSGSAVSNRSSDSKLVVAWIRLLDMLEPHLFQFIHQNRGCPNGELDELLPDAEEPDSASVTGVEKEIKKEINNPPAIALGHKALLEFITQLISIYDSCNAGGLWSYLRPTPSEQGSIVSITALAVASFLSDRVLTCMSSGGSQDMRQNNYANSDVQSNDSRSGVLRQNSQIPNHLVAARNEITRLRKLSLSKLEGARKTKYYIENAHFIDALTESVKRNDKVQYCEGVQLIGTFVKSKYSAPSDGDEDGCIYINKILPTFND